MQKGECQVENQKYFLGLDIGTDSVGFAITDTEYNVIKKGKKDLIGVHLFKAGKTAEARRIARSSRIRLHRRKERLTLLQTLFDSEISKSDIYFFERLDESMYHYDDKTIPQKNSLFNDTNYSDKNYYGEYKTAYHLRASLINEDIFDARILYLGIAHIMKNRGHFLFEGREFGAINDFDVIFAELNKFLEENYEDEIFNFSDHSKLQNIIKSREFGVNDKSKQICNLLSNPSAFQKKIIDLLVGKSVDLRKIFSDLFGEKTTISFKDNADAYDQKYQEVASVLGDGILLIDLAKAIYDYSVLSDILHDEVYLSTAKVKSYDEHHNDLCALKKLVRAYKPNEYKNIFNAADIAGNYPSYIGCTKKNGSKIPILKKCSQEDFCKFILRKLKDVSDKITENEYLNIISKAENNRLCPKQITKDNGIIPYQLHLAELEKILQKQEKNFPFLSVSDGKYTVSEKIKILFLHRIPYYVGHLNTYDKNRTWMIKNEGKETEKITPWNFKDVINFSETAEKFIERMTSRCRHLNGENVIPKDSLLYSEFALLNEINSLKINDEPISINAKKKLIDELFKTKIKGKITEKKIKDYLVRNCICDKNASISGIDIEIKSSLKSYNDLTEIFGDFDIDMAEDIIRWVVLFGNEKSMLKKKIIDNYPVTDEQLKHICALKYAGWGSCSKKFLTDVYLPDVNTGEAINIITALRNTNCNLMQLLGKDFGFQTAVDERNSKFKTSGKLKITHNDVEELYCSPAVKKAIWQTVLIVKECEKIMGGKPTKVFVEIPRDKDGANKKIRTVSRQKALLELYKSCKNEYPEIYTNLKKTTDTKLQSKKLYLWFTQLGRCAYTGKAIDFDDLFNDNLWDIDHIYPRSKTKDNSLHNNLLLVSKTSNSKKSDVYPIPTEFRQDALWKLWFEKKLISKEKFSRLMRVNEFSESELSGFIARQLVETRQSTKAVAEILNEYFGNKSEVVYSKAVHVSDFRQHFNITKCREINDYHHAHDAYLNIVVGNVFNTKFTKNFFKKGAKQQKYSLNPEVLYPTKSNEIKYGDYAWKEGENGTIKTVKNVISNNNILFTRAAYTSSGELFNIQLNKKLGENNKTDRLAMKNRIDKLKDFSKYGSYKVIKGAYFCVVEHLIKGERNRTIEYVPIYLANEIKKDKTVLLDYLRNTVGVIQPKIILSELKIDSLLNINGFPGHLSSRTGDRLILKGAVQLILNAKDISYIKLVTSFANKYKSNKDLKTNFIINKERNIEIYDLFIDKLQNSIYKKRLALQGDVLSERRIIFTELDAEQQCVLLSSCLNLFACNAVNPDISLIGGGKDVGKMLINKNISNLAKCYLINQSVTGVYENKINLLTYEGEKQWVSE